MFKDKLNKMLGDGEPNSKRKIENLVFFIIILIVTIIGINLVWKDDIRSQESNEIDTGKTLASNSETQASEKDELSNNLEEI